MSADEGLTAQQLEFVNHPTGAFLTACPGSGKTRTVVARVTRLMAMAEPRRGVALLSFTNSAVDEFEARCRKVGASSALALPSYVATFDAFVRHFIVNPRLSPISEKPPIIVKNWDSLGIEVRLARGEAFRGEAASLDAFDPQTNAVNLSLISDSALRNHVRQNRDGYEEIAARKRRGLIRAGYLSSADARAIAQSTIRDPKISQALGLAIAARFQEIIVDEGQDCNQADIQILNWLRQYGVQVSMVCDPDQAIYEFRDGTPEHIRQFKATYATGSCLSMTGNFRSCPSVCQAASTLRQDGEADTSLGEAAALMHPLLILRYTGTAPHPAIGRAFSDHIASLNVDQQKAIVLAHSANAAQRACTGVPAGEVRGTSRIAQVASCVSDFWSASGSSRSKEEAMQRAETIFLDLMGLREDREHTSRTIERHGIDKRAFRRLALHFLLGIPQSCENTESDRQNWITALKTQAGNLGLQLAPGTTIGNFFRRPTSHDWTKNLREPTALGIGCAKIHSVKGQEFDAVCVVIPPNRAPANYTAALFDAWEQRADSEAKRVIYVGVTRARCAAAIAVPTAFLQRCEALMTLGNVPYEVRNVA
jgi:DNA helicase II / ATP-dependent DNA helicase PcrA